jgi:hypothetical protein
MNDAMMILPKLNYYELEALPPHSLKKERLREKQQNPNL